MAAAIIPRPNTTVVTIDAIAIGRYSPIIMSRAKIAPQSNKNLKSVSVKMRNILERVNLSFIADKYSGIAIAAPLLFI